MYDSVKTIELKTLIVFNLVFHNNPNLAFFFFIFMMTDLYFLNPAVNAQLFNPSAQKANEGNAETEVNSLTTKTKVNCSK